MTDNRLPEQLNGLLTGFVEDLRNRMGEGLLSITVYGSAARGDYVDGASDINVLVVARELPAPALKAAGQTVRHWRERMPISPIFATEDYLARSADVFPLEFLEMRDAHQTLYGPDPLAGLPVQLHFLRHQVEAELKGKLMRLRTAYASVADQQVAVRDLLRESLSSFRVLFQGALRLTGEAPPIHNADVMRAVAAKFDLDSAALDDVLAVHDRRGRADVLELDALFGRYLAVVERLAHIVDAWSESGEKTGNADNP